MSRNLFLGGVVTGAAGTVAGLWACGLLLPVGRTVSLERSIQVRRPAAEVFAACARLDKIPEFIRSVVSIEACEDVSEWIADLNGRRFAWDVEILQVIPGQVIGWKSHRGPRHSGRISFFSLGDETLVHLGMNYVPEVALSNLLQAPVWWNIGGAIEGALRDLKRSVEAESSPRTVTQATGTYGPSVVEYSTDFERPARNEYP